MGYKLDAMAAANKHVSLQICRSSVGCDAGPHVGVVCVNGCICSYRALHPGGLISHTSRPILHLRLDLAHWVGLYSQELLQKFSQVPRCMSPKTCKVMAGRGVEATVVMAVGKFTASA